MTEQRIYRNEKGICFDYRRASTDFLNHAVDNERWHLKEYWFLSVRINPRWWAVDEFHYDGHTYKGFTFCGIEVGKGYAYDSRNAKNWPVEKTLTPK